MNKVHNTSDKKIPKRNWFRISLRTFLLTSIVSVIVVAFLCRNLIDKYNTICWIYQHGGRIGQVSDPDYYLPLVFEDITKVHFLNPPKLKNLKPLTCLSTLKELDIIGGKIEDYSSLSELKSLQRINLEESNFRNLNVLKNLPKLKYLEIGGSEVNDLVPLSKSLTLETIIFGTMEIEDLSPLEEIKSLKTAIVMMGPPYDERPIEELQEKRPDAAIISTFYRKHIRF